MSPPHLQSPFSLSISTAHMASEKKFKPTQEDVEAAEDYHPYEYCPVQVGDCFTERYEACRKHWYGTFSTVWLAKDMSERLTSFLEQHSTH